MFSGRVRLAALPEPLRRDPDGRRGLEGGRGSTLRGDGWPFEVYITIRHHILAILIYRSYSYSLLYTAYDMQI